ncbi:MAG: RDD family protein [Gammaproteobacteria bacterium]
MPDSIKNANPAKLFPRLAALFYDSLLLLAVLFGATILILPFNNGQAIQANNPFYSSYIFIVSFLFFGWFWMHGGQTLGMRAWRLRLIRIDGKHLSWWHALLRFLTAIPAILLGGIGYWWLLIDKEKLALHDRISETMVEQLDENPHRRVK